MPRDPWCLMVPAFRRLVLTSARSNNPACSTELSMCDVPSVIMLLVHSDKVHARNSIVIELLLKPLITFTRQDPFSGFAASFTSCLAEQLGATFTLCFSLSNARHTWTVFLRLIPAHSETAPEIVLCAMVPSVLDGSQPQHIWRLHVWVFAAAAICGPMYHLWAILLPLKIGGSVHEHKSGCPCTPPGGFISTRTPWGRASGLPYDVFDLKRLYRTCYCTVSDYRGVSMTKPVSQSGCIASWQLMSRHRSAPRKLDVGALGEHKLPGGDPELSLSKN